MATKQNPWLSLVKIKLAEVNKENKNLGGTQALREAINRARKSFVKRAGRSPVGVSRKLK